VFYARPSPFRAALEALYVEDRNYLRKPDDKSPEPPGGRAAERLREFWKQRVPDDQAEDQAEENKPDSWSDDAVHNPDQSQSDDKQSE